MNDQLSEACLTSKWGRILPAVQWCYQKRSNSIIHPRLLLDYVLGLGTTCEDLKGHESTLRDLEGLGRMWKDFEEQERTLKVLKGLRRTLKDFGELERTWEDLK